jgi:hypothetical protein
MAGYGRRSEPPYPAGMESHWYRVRRSSDGVVAAMVIAYPLRGELSLSFGPGAGLRIDPVAALGLSTCLSVAVERSFPTVQAAGLVLEGDMGQGWRPL